MIRFFRRYQGAGFALLVLLAALLMISFGVDFTSPGGGKKSREAAVQVDDTVISHREFYEKRRDVENRYRKMFGQQYEALAKQFNLNIGQNVVDGLIENALLVREAKRRGFVASDDGVISTIQSIFPGGYDPQALRASGKSADEFLRDIEDGLVRAALEDVLKDSASSSEREARSSWVLQNTKYSAEYVELDPKNFLSEVKSPSEDELKAFFDEHSEEFKLPPRVSYEYVAFRPDSFLKEIEVPRDEIEFYYTDNAPKFENPEQLKLRHIQLLYPKEPDPAKMSAVKDKAKEAYDKAKSGQSFESLVQQYSDDYTTRSSGGDLGWVPKGRYSSEFDEKTYQVKDGGLADLIETDYGFHIVKVEGHKEASEKPLSEVEGRIEADLKAEQAPAYADTKAREFFDLVTGSDRPLAELAKEKGFTAASTNGLLAAGSDPESSLAGLTAKILEESGDARQFVELKDIGVVVAVKDQKDAEVPALGSIRDAVLAKYTAARSILLARERADDLLKAVKGGKSLEDAARERKLPVETKTGLSMSGKLPPPFDNEAVLSAVFGARAIPSTPEKVVYEKGKFYLLRALSKKQPEPSEMKPEETEAIRAEQTRLLAAASVKSLTGSLKSAAQIDVDQSILNAES